MPYKDSLKRREANRKAQSRRRGGDMGVTESQGVTVVPTSEGVTAGVTDVIPSGQGVTGVNPPDVNPKPRNVNPGGMVRVNPANGLAYGPSMASLPDGVLAEYERKWKQYEPRYGGIPGEHMAHIAIDEGFTRVHTALATKGLENEVRVGVYGPTVKELWGATHP